MQTANCKEANYVKQMMNPGRTCSSSAQCKSRDCRETCVGFEMGENCHEHSDCLEGAYCHDNTDWPFASVCKEYREDGSECTSDFQCPVTHYCWYKTKADKKEGRRRCMELYSAGKGATFGWK